MGGGEALQQTVLHELHTGALGRLSRKGLHACGMVILHAVSPHTVLPEGFAKGRDMLLLEVHASCREDTQGDATRAD